MDFLFDLENPLISFKEHQSDIVPTLFSDECVLFVDNFPAKFRRDGLMVISKFCENLDPLVSYLAVNYMDRFISTQKVINQEKPWMVGLVAITCLSLAAKMRNSSIDISNLSGYQRMVYDAKLIGRMEVLILTCLKWRMRSITPFSFICYFLSLLKLKDMTFLSQAIKERASRIILKSSYEIKLLEFRPSVIAASALLHASQDLVPRQHSHIRAAISTCKYLNNENVEDCLCIMQEMGFDSSESISVLDYQCPSSESDSSTSIKKRRLDDVF
uniref:putative cyclin-D6-1 n=1 Tax=Erigeron canadensis TaxID=72917 RepID=UPI001CB9CE6F|nr:putative cyclin-D6-1 [Erigeron canadensis]